MADCNAELAVYSPAVAETGAKVTLSGLENTRMVDPPKYQSQY